LQKSKHYLELDGLRGVAAFAVLLFHRRTWFGGEFFLGHAYLAVDFFFILSGFVIALAYGRRLTSNNSLLPYLRDRAIRLYPLMILAAAVGFTAACLGTDAASGKSIVEIGAAAVASGFGAPAIWDRNPFWINGPIWSLSFEIAVNVLYGFIAFGLTTRRLHYLIGASVFAMILISWHLGGFVVGGHRSTMPMGIVRVVASFFIGIALYRLHLLGILANGGKRWWIAPALIASFVILPKDSSWSFIYDPVVVFLLYPTLVLAAAGSAAIMARVAVWSGAVSFPLYVLHEPLLRVLEHAFLSAGDSGPLAIKLLCVGLTVAIAWASLRFYDIPVRTMLRRRFGSKRHSGIPEQAV
jgi:peptidoglycan/LPS O-acetylase OafA/YrhL